MPKRKTTVCLMAISALVIGCLAYFLMFYQFGHWDSIGIEASGQTSWALVVMHLGPPDETPPPNDSLLENDRIYHGVDVRLHVSTRKMIVEGKTRFQEVVTGVGVSRRHKD